MIKLNINLDYKRDPKTVGEISNRDLTYNYVVYAAKQKYPDGMEGQLRRSFSRIQRKFDDAIETQVDFIEIEQAEKDLLIKMFDDKIKFPSELSKFVSVLEDEITNLGKEK